MRKSLVKKKKARPKSSKIIIKWAILINYMPNVWVCYPGKYTIKYRDYKLSINGPKYNAQFEINNREHNYLDFEELKHYLSKKFVFNCQEKYPEAECPLFSSFFPY